MSFIIHSTTHRERNERQRSETTFSFSSMLNRNHLFSCVCMCLLILSFALRCGMMMNVFRLSYSRGEMSLVSLIKLIENSDLHLIKHTISAEERKTNFNPLPRPFTLIKRETPISIFSPFSPISKLPSQSFFLLINFIECCIDKICRSQRSI
jgi:hypothetical protein